MKKVFVLALVLVGCVRADQGGADKGPGTPPPVPPKPSLEVVVQVSSVSLADDCGASATPASPPAAEMAASARMKPGGSFAAQDCARGADCGHLGGCQQTTMQLALEAGAEGGVTEVHVDKIELLDEQGAVVGLLTGRDPKLFDGKAYVAWAGSIGPKQRLNISYDLSAPDWSKLGGSRMAAQGRMFKVRVTTRIGDKAVENVAVSAIIVQEPHVVT